MSLLYNNEKRSYRNSSAMNGLPNSSISNVIKRKTEYMGAISYNATPDRKIQNSHAFVDRIVLEVIPGRKRGLIHTIH